MNRVIDSVSDAVPYQEFARLIGKTPAAVKGMIEKGKLPVSASHRLTSISGKGKPRARCRVSSIPKLPADVCH